MVSQNMGRFEYFCRVFFIRWRLDSMGLPASEFSPEKSRRGKAMSNMKAETNSRPFGSVDSGKFLGFL